MPKETIFYCTMRFGGRWWVTFAPNIEEALRLQHRLEKEGIYGFAGQSGDLETAHWQVREALRTGK